MPVLWYMVSFRSLAPSQMWRVPVAGQTVNERPSGGAAGRHLLYFRPAMKSLRAEAVRVVVEPVDLSVAPESAVVSFSAAKAPAILESSASTAPYSRFTILACNPVDEFVYGHKHAGCPFRALRDHVAQYPTVENPDVTFG